VPARYTWHALLHSLAECSCAGLHRSRLAVACFQASELENNWGMMHEDGQPKYSWECAPNTRTPATLMPTPALVPTSPAPADGSSAGWPSTTVIAVAVGAAAGSALLGGACALGLWRRRRARAAAQRALYEWREDPRL
jgi:hypothetical protein